MNRTNLIEDLTLVPLPPWWQSPGTLLALAAGLAVLAAIGWAVWRARRLRPTPPPPLAPEPDRAPEFLQRLEALRARRDTLSAHDFGLECSDILREYLEWRHRLAVRFQTTREFLESAARGADLTQGQREGLREFLGFCDLVKFARQGATPEEKLRLADAAVAFVRQGGSR
ncbi:MAG: hypothetical protein KIT22_15505 [Verrucomicrobiae bacterium]|nr:hypothetical protein [Verrucomicrobiae bacterium]